MAMSICVLLGTTRVGRKSLHVAQCVLGDLSSRQGLHVEFLDLAECNIPIMRERLSELADPPLDLRRFSSTLSEADSIVLVVPEYKNGYPGSLKNALDYLDPGLFRYKPIAIVTVSSGGFGGVNCLSQLRLVCLALGGLPIPDALPISHVQEKFDVDGNLKDDKLRSRLRDFVDEFLWYSLAMYNQRTSGGSR